MSLPKPTSGGKTDSKPGTTAKVPVTDNVGDEKPANIVVVDREETGGEGVDNEFYDVSIKNSNFSLRSSFNECLLLSS